MSKKPVIVSFYTPDYQAEYDRFTQSVAPVTTYLNLDTHKMEPRGQWIHNVYQRAEFVREMLETHKRDVIWVDIDAEFIKEPKKFYDFPGREVGAFGAHIISWPSGKREVLGGTMYFSYHTRCLALVKLWCYLNKTLPLQPRSQLVLQRALHYWQGPVVELPPEYTYIPRFMPDVKDPVILHHQASGKHRRPDREGIDIELVTGEPQGEDLDV